MSATTIRIDTDTRDRLRALGRMGEAYDDVIRRLLDSNRSLPTMVGETGRRPLVAPPKPLFAHQERK
ncbi:MAG: hypothetical protein WCA77_05620 [Thermoplasmata archaeon]